MPCIRHAWDAYQTVDQARAETSAELAAARTTGVTMYRMSKWLEVTERAIKVRLETYDRSQPRP